MRWTTSAPRPILTCPMAKCMLGLGGPDALADRRGKAKEANGQLTEMELKDLEIKRLKARLAHVSTEVAVLKKLQEFERMDAQQKKNISQFKHSRKK